MDPPGETGPGVLLALHAERLFPHHYQLFSTLAGPDCQGLKRSWSFMTYQLVEAQAIVPMVSAHQIARPSTGKEVTFWSGEGDLHFLGAFYKHHIINSHVG